jgi:hypothetical protein
MAHLRSMLNADAPDAEAVIGFLKEWPDDHSREAALRYARDHFERNRPADLAPPMTFAAESHMLFDPNTNTLFTNLGQEIKRLECPKTKCWDELEVVDDLDLKRMCRDCDKHVVDTRGLTDAQVHVLVQFDPTVCLHIDTEHGNVTLINHEDPYTSRPAPGTRVIKTARTRNAINLAASKGLWPLVKRVVSSNGHISSFCRVWQHRDTGEVVVQTDIRYPGFHGDYTEWDVLFRPEDSDSPYHGGDIGYDASNHFPEPFAAYLVPDDIAVGERVFLEDVIENFIGHHHQGSTRLRSAEAVWNGADFEIDYDEQRDAAHYIG